MMAGKIITCLERNFPCRREGAFIKGRSYNDLLWFRQSEVRPLEKKLAKDCEKVTPQAECLGHARTVLCVKAVDRAWKLSNSCA